MAFELPALPYDYEALQPFMSKETLEYHHDKHHKAYVDNGNKLAAEAGMENLSLEEVVKQSFGKNAGLFNNAAQHYNHMFFWKSLEPHGTNMPPDLKAAVEAQYGSVEKLQAAFTDAALKLFGSGWVYWVYDLKAQQFDLVSYTNAGCPLTDINLVPLLTCDVWEHAYYIDYQNDRSKYVSKFFDVADYHWAERNWKRGRGEKYEPMNYY